jgi:hypothetical protein
MTNTYNGLSKILSVKKILAALLCILMLHAQAQDNPTVMFFTGNAMVPGATQTLIEPAYTQYKNSINQPVFKNLVSFKIDEEAGIVPKSKFDATVTFNLTITDVNNQVQVLNNQVLKVGFDIATGAKYDAGSFLAFDKGYKVKIDIVQLLVQNHTGWNPADVLKLLIEVQPQHVYKFDNQNAINACKIIFTEEQVNAVNANNSREVAITFAPVTGATEYDVEWTYIDKLVYNGLRYGTPGSAAFADNIFKNNATRVTLQYNYGVDATNTALVNALTANNIPSTNKAYIVPLLYEDEGKLLARVRSVQTLPDGQRVETPWSNLDVYDYIGHHKTLNWQASTSFAEEGKRKSVVQYFDGSLRNRQTVTKDNTTNKTVVAETLYDYQGRPAIQVLPAPTMDNLLKFSVGLNTTINNAAYDKDVFDKVTIPGTYCKPVIAAMSSNTGAAKYYSPQNALINAITDKKEYNNYIPDANGYPFTQTQYLSDGTGRIKAQSGVGDQYKLGSDHETKYYYATPDQVELNLLFGTEVGNASHYFKNMVRDANGQYSVSYVDMHGRTIATALAGDLPAGSPLSELKSKKDLDARAPEITKTLSGAANNVAKGFTIESVKSFVVTKAGLNKFKYSFNPTALVLNTCVANQVNTYNCTYDLEVTLSDDCNNENNGGVPLVIFSNKNLSLANTQPIDLLYQSVLKEGNYTVTKKLTINQDVLANYRDNIFLRDNLCKTEEDFIKDEEKAFVDLGLDCNPTYESCVQRLGDSATFRAAWLKERDITQPTADDEALITQSYKAILKECNLLKPENNTELTRIRRAMLRDVTPTLGQYANPDEVDAYSIFAQEGAGSNFARYYHYANSTYKYFDEQGVIDRSPQTIYRGDKNGFIDNYKPSWTETLLQAHPEYAKLKALETIVGAVSYEYDKDMLNTETYLIAKQKGYLNPTGIASLSSKYPINKIDPFYTLSATYLVPMNSFLQTGFNGSAWAAASVTGACPTNNQVCVDAQKANPFNETLYCAGELDMAWKAFRGLYLAKKKEFIRQITDAAGNVNYNNLLTRYNIYDNNGAVIATGQHTVYFYNHAQTLAQQTGINLSTPKDVEDADKNQSSIAAKQKMYETNCNSFTDVWWSQLAPCTTAKLEPKKQEILAHLVQVCIKGSDDEHMLGASSISPLKTYTFKSFEEVIKFYVDAYNTTAAPADKINGIDCNGLLITFPSSYQTIIPADKPVYQKPAECECKQIQLIQSIYDISKLNASETFSAFMKRVYQTDITDADFTTLQSLCKGDIKCNFLPQPVTLPPVLQCNPAEVCVPCNTVLKAYTSYKDLYPGVLPVYEANTDEEVKYNTLFTSFMNSRLGFGKQTADYLDFMKTCGNIEIENAECLNLKKIVDDYYVQAPGAFKYSLLPTNTFDRRITDNKQLFINGALSIPAQYKPEINVNWYKPFIIDRPGRFCMQDGNSVEYRIKTTAINFYLRAMPNGVVIVFSKNSNGLFITNFVPDAGANNFTGIVLIDANPDILNNSWNNIRIETKPSSFKIYFNERLVTTIARDVANPVNDNGGYLEASFHGDDFSIDRLRVLDAAGAEKFVEEFINPVKPVVAKASDLCDGLPNCETSFTNYYNQKQSTSYTFQQIADLYKQTCGKDLEVCNKCIDYQKILNSYISEATCYKDTIVLQKSPSAEKFPYSRPLLALNGNAVIPYNNIPEANILSYFFNGADDYSNEYQVDASDAYTYSMRFKIDKPIPVTASGSYIAGGVGNQFYFWYNQTGQTPDARYPWDLRFEILYPDGTRDINYIAHYSPEVFNLPFVIDDGNYHTISVKVSRSSMKFSIDGIVLMNAPRKSQYPVNLLNRGIGFNYNTNDNRVNYIDYYKLEKDNGEIIYFEDFTDPNKSMRIDKKYFVSTKPSSITSCSDCFTNYFNQQQNTSYTFQQIADLYKQTCGKELDVCGAQLSTCDSMLNIYNDYKCIYAATKNNKTVNTGACNYSSWFQQGYTNEGYDFFRPSFSLDHMSKHVKDGIFRFSIDTSITNVNYGGLGYMGGSKLFDRGFKSNNSISYEVRARASYKTTGNPVGNTVSFGYYTSSINQVSTDQDEDFFYTLTDGPVGSYRLRWQYYNNIPELGNININDWNVYKYVVTPQKSQILVNGVVIKEIIRDGRSFIDAVNGLNISFGNAAYAEVDWLKAYSGDTLFFNDDFTGPSNNPFAKPDTNYLLPIHCGNWKKIRFPNFFNFLMHTSYTFEQIDSLYKTKCGINISICEENTAKPLTGPMLCGRNLPLSKIIGEIKETTVCDDKIRYAISRGMERFKLYKEELLGNFTQQYLNECFKAVNNDKLTVTQGYSEYHYTLYYYNQAGNLVKTVPPEGVDTDPLYNTQSFSDAVQNARLANTAKVPAHNLTTHYRYNTLNQVVAQKTPDAGMSNFWYDRLGRLAVSQNARQLADGNNYSYTKYDGIGRITEIGQINTPAAGITDATSRDTTQLKNWLNTNNSKRQQITTTVYDVLGKNLSAFGFTQDERNLRNRVSYTSFTQGNNPVNYNAASFFSYDIHGNVSKLIHDYTAGSAMAPSGNQYKLMAYEYDLISGKVNKVSYQPGYKDALYHKYQYDAENRITKVFTSYDDAYWEADARYEYYRHGPLARTTLGQLQVQGLDYAYTLQGWLKTVNGNVLNENADMGADGKPTGAQINPVAKDAFAFSLHYNSADYKAINKPGFMQGLQNQLGASQRNLYNGNISSMAVNMGTLPNTGGPMLYNYRYDQLNRLVNMDAFTGTNTGTHLWDNGLTATNAYKESIQYDANGNITNYLRNGATSNIAMDELRYGYNKDVATGRLLNNKLRHVKDAVPNTNYTEDIDDQADDNYSYDAIGNLIADNKEGITAISWNVYGKISSITKTLGGVTTNISYTYDASGNRISKKVGAVTTWYVRDAQGNTMAVYTVGDNNVNTGKATLTEQHLYGSSRLGILNRSLDVSNTTLPFTTLSTIGSKAYFSTFRRGNKFFELTNHLGNVLVVVSDKKIAVPDPNNTSQILYYTADVISAQDYYPGGMLLPGRTYQAGAASYRYSFNGQEKTDEISGAGNHTTALFWEYDTRLGRRWNVDPLAHKLPSYSPYVAMANNPIMFFDPDGAFPYTFHIRAFAPPGAFKGTGFHDDNRGFSTSMSATSRIKQNFTIDPTKQTYSGGTPTSDPTIWNGLSKTATDKGGISKPEFGKNSLGSATASVTSNFEGSNPFFLGAAPNIEVSSAISITENLKTNQLFVALDLSSKQFPATEGLIQDNAGNTLLLAGAVAFGSAGNLTTADKKKAATVDLIIGINDKGVFQNVTIGGKKYTLEEFNKLGTSKPAGPLPREDKDK